MKRTWKRKGLPASHADDWLMTYADMITLLLCFFTVFMSVSIAKKPVPQTVQAPPPVSAPATATPMPPEAEPTLPVETMPFHKLTDADIAPDNSAEPPVPPPEPVAAKIETPPAPVEAVKPPEPEPAPENVIVAGGMSAPLDPPPAVGLQSQIPVSPQQEGDRITTMEMNSAAFFASGDATLSETGKVVLRDVADKIQSGKFAGYQITVEGHTDDTPIKTARFPSNWELSTARASAVVHFFIEQGISAERLRAAGYADTFPKVPNRDAAGNPIPENRAQNRRVVIKLEKIDRTE